jgi:tRNA A37 threonylcarbamoyladenosine synthetase subunit TsaC/SUA5/YrdC
MPAPDSYAALEQRIRTEADLVIDDGVRHSLVASTVVACTGAGPRVLRSGSVAPDLIARVAGPVTVEA